MKLLMTLTVIQQFKGCTWHMAAIIFSATRKDMVIPRKATVTEAMNVLCLKAPPLKQ